MKAKTSEIIQALFGTILFWLVIIPFIYIWIPRWILLSPKYSESFEIGIYRYLGLIPIIVGAVLWIYCSGSFVFVGIGTPVPFTPTKKLIVTGFYRFVRNPLYLAGFIVLIGEGILFQSAGIIIYSIVIFGHFHLLVILEEAFLEKKFGDSYKQYCKSVPRWIPRIKPYKVNGSDSA